MRKWIFSKALIGVWLALATFLLTELLAAFPSVTERIYSQGIYPFIAQALSSVSHLLPFSLDDVFYVVLTILAVATVVALLLRKIRWRKFLFVWLNTLSILYILFYWLWGFNYFREDLNKRLAVAESHPDSELFLNVFESLIEKTNKSYVRVDSLDKMRVDSLIENAYKQFAPFLKVDYPAGIRRPKPITFSHFFAQATISGYYGPFFNEVHVNPHLLPVEYPMVLAHEKAHQLGITSEAEANFYAWLTCSFSPSKHLQYSANLYVLRFFIYEAHQLDGYSELIAKLDDQVKEDFKRIRAHWMELRNEKIDHYASKVNDAYLKTNKVKKGIDDYTGVVKFVMDFSTDSTATMRLSDLLNKKMNDE